MAQSQRKSVRKSVRKLVALPPELAERVEKFRQEVGASSESDALKMLIEDGLKMKDRPEDLFDRLMSATQSGQNIADIIAFLASDHPLVASTVLNANELIIYLRSVPDMPDERFYYSRPGRYWAWERQTGYDVWENTARQEPERKTRDDLNAEIPF